MEDHTIDVESDSEEDVKKIGTGSPVDTGLTAHQLSSLCPSSTSTSSSSSELLRQTDDKQAKHQQCSATADKAEDVPEKALNANVLLDCQQADPIRQDKPVVETQKVTEAANDSNKSKQMLEPSSQGGKTTITTADQGAQSYHTVDQLLTISSAAANIEQQHWPAEPPPKSSDQLQSVAAEAADNQFAVGHSQEPLTKWPTSTTADNSISAPLESELAADNDDDDNDSKDDKKSNVHEQFDCSPPLPPPVEHPIEHQLLQQSASSSSNSNSHNSAQSILRKSDQILHYQQHPLEPQKEKEEEQQSGDSEDATTATTTSLLRVTSTSAAAAPSDTGSSSSSPSASPSAEPVTRAATAAEEEEEEVVVASNSLASAAAAAAAVPPCDYQLREDCTSEQSALSTLSPPPIASLTSSTSLPITTITTSTITTDSSNSNSHSIGSEKCPSSLSLAGTSAHQRRADITATSIDDQHQQHQQHQHDTNSCQKAPSRPVRTTADRKLIIASDRVAANSSSNSKSSKRRLEKQYPLTTFSSDREPSISFLASYPPQTQQTESSASARQLASPHHHLGATSFSSIDSFSEHTPLLGASHSHSRKDKTQQGNNSSSTTSLSSSTLSLFLESLKVNTGLTKKTTKKNNAEKKSSKLVDTTVQFDNPLAYQQHPLAQSDSQPIEHHHLSSSSSPTMSNQLGGNSSPVAFNAPIPLRAVAVAPPVAEKMSLNQRAAAAAESGATASPTSKANGHSGHYSNGAGNSSTSQQISTPQQRYLASLLDAGGDSISVSPNQTAPTAGNISSSSSSSFRDTASSSKAYQPQQQHQLSFQAYPNPKSSTAPATAAAAASAMAVVSTSQGRQGAPQFGSSSGAGHYGSGSNNHHHRGHHHNHHRCYVSSGSYEGGNTGMTTTDDDTCSLSSSSSTSKHDEAFSLKFPKLRYVKVALLAGLIIYTLISFIAIQEKEDKWTNVAAQEGIPAYVDLSHSLDLMFPVWKLRAKGSFLPAEYRELTNYSIVFTVVQLLNDSQGADRNGAYRLVKGPWAAPITPPKLAQYMNTEVEHVFKLTRGDAYDHIHRYQLRIDTNSEESVGITVNMAGFSELSADGIILATTVLVFLYTLIIFEIVNRTLAAMLGATAAITCLTLIRDRPSLEKVVSWLDVETLCLLFGMMVLVAILCETGFFDYIAVVAFRLAKGRTWPLIFTLCFFTGILSAFLDNVTTILLMTPVTIRLCEIKNIDPKFVLIAQVMFSNIGGAATPVGDPPNVIIISSLKIQKQGVDFGRFTLHMMPGILLSFAATLLYIRIAYRSLSSNDTLSEGNSSDIESPPTTKTNSAAVSYQYPLPLSPLAASFQAPLSAETSSSGANHPRSQSEPQFGRQPGAGRPSSSTAAAAAQGNSRRNGAPSRVSTSPTNQLESSSEFDSYSYGANSHAPRGLNSRLLRSSSGHQGIKDAALEQCLSCNSMDDFCAGTSVRDSILDERRVFRSSDELKREIEVWKRATNSISGYSRDENSVRNVLNRKVEILETVLQEHCYETVPPEDNYHSVLAELEEKYKIRDYPLLYKSGIVMSLVISLFFMQSIPNLDLSLGWIAILGAILLLVLADRHELESIISRVEWSTLIFFAALFVVMEALAELKFLWWIGRLTQDFINSVPEAQRLVVAILLFTWISAFASSFIDNIPLTTVMVKILEDLSENNEFNIPLVPLIYALAFGACLGGNGTLIGASSNVVCAGVAEQHGYRFTFMDFFKVGFPIMLLTVGISSVYLVVCHVIFDWNY